MGLDEQGLAIGRKAGPVAALLVSLVENTDNARAIVTDLHLEGEKLWDSF
jgi:hypothetical protein